MMIGAQNFVEDPLKADKGLKDGSCNRRTCQAPGATWWNKGTGAYYCKDCARKINSACRFDGFDMICLPARSEE